MPTFTGLRTVLYYVEEMDRAKAWWSDLLGLAPYFDEPFYIGFNVAGYELGLHPQKDPAGPGVVTYWGVEDIESAFAELLAAGAVVHDPIAEVGGGIKAAAAVDPFGNVVGLIYNPHFSLP